MFDFDPFRESTEHHSLIKKHRRLVIREGIQSDDFFRSETETLLNPYGGMISTEVSGVHSLGCQHTILSPTDLGAPCQCGKTLCRACSSVRCATCLEIYCSTCLVPLDSVPYCRPCRRKKIFKNFFSWSIESLHTILSKEF